MKLFALFLVIFLSMCVECQKPVKHKRSIHVLDYLTNKTSQITNYVSKKGRSLKNYAVNKVKDTSSWVSSYFSHGKKKVLNYVDDKSAKSIKKFQHYIDIAQNTAGTIYDAIAPEQDDYECSNDDTGIYMTTAQLITLHGYAVETHNVITDDGYILTVHRIPPRSNKTSVTQKTVLLQHGLLGSSADWVIPGPKEALAYILADAGYDVWMGNARGNTYSKAHVSRRVDTYAFWNFTFHEIGYYDLPAVIDYINTKKGGDAEIIYIGFSMGTTALFAMLSTRPEYNDILKSAYAMAPIAFMTEMKSPFKILGALGNNLEYFLKLLGANEFLPHNAVIRYLSKHSCSFNDIEDAFCEISMYLMCGHDKEHFNRSLSPMIFGHLPAGASTKTLAHFAQEIRNDGRFQLFDYGSEGNLREYRSDSPPEYPVENITLPIVLMSGKDDWLSSVTDASQLYLRLSNPIEHYIVPDMTFNHLDFLFARDARRLVYDKLLILLNN